MEAINVLADLVDLSDCQESITGGNDVQMMSWDSDVISFRCGNTSAFFIVFRHKHLLSLILIA